MEDKRKTKIIGLIRYSVLNSWDPRTAFPPEYMKYRFKIFCEVTLKSFQEQTDKDFMVFLFHSNRLPDEYKGRFEELERENRFLHSIYLEKEGEEEYQNEINSNIVKYADWSENIIINFRIDNDDGLPKNYISRIRPFLKQEFEGYALTLPRISVVQRLAEDKYVIEQRRYLFTCMGQAIVISKDNVKNCQAYQHNSVYDNYPVVLLQGTGGWQTINGNNSANSIRFGDKQFYTKKELDEYLLDRNYPDYDMSCLHIVKNGFRISNKLKSVGKKVIKKIFSK
jgi:hypothetical protein